MNATSEQHFAEEKFDAVLAKLKKEVVAPVTNTKEWYKDHAYRPRIFFSVSGLLVILLSVSVPFIAAQDDKNFLQKDILLSAAALAIAALTGLSSFFQWQAQWQSYRQTQFLLEYLLQKWELDAIKARSTLDTEPAISTIIEAAGKLLDQAQAATGKETETYFKGIRMPSKS